MEQAQLARENARRAALGLEPIASLEDLDTSVDVPGSILLDQAARIALEMALMRDGERRQLVTREQSTSSTASADEATQEASSATRRASPSSPR